MKGMLDETDTLMIPCSFEKNQLSVITYGYDTTILLVIRISGDTIDRRSTSVIWDLTDQQLPNLCGGQCVLTNEKWMLFSSAPRTS